MLYQFIRQDFLNYKKACIICNPISKPTKNASVKSYICRVKSKQKENKTLIFDVNAMSANRKLSQHNKNNHFYKTALQWSLQ